MKRLYKSRTEKILGGVCGGFAQYFDVDPTIVRILWIVFSFAYLTGVLAYIIAWIIMPEEPEKKAPRRSGSGSSRGSSARKRRR